MQVTRQLPSALIAFASCKWSGVEGTDGSQGRGLTHCSMGYEQRPGRRPGGLH